MAERIVLNIPHSSSYIPENTWDADILPEISRWTDWHTDVLFRGRNERVIPVTFGFSRFYCDAERLENDPLEAKGQGFAYTDFNGCRRELTIEEKECLHRKWALHQDRLKSELKDNTVLIDCHSFPSDLSDIDVCIGFNEDAHKPSDELIRTVVSHFEGYGYKVGINEPYANSISPESESGYVAFMVELNKRIYLDEKTNEMKPYAYKINHILNYLYEKILG